MHDAQVVVAAGNMAQLRGEAYRAMGRDHGLTKLGQLTPLIQQQALNAAAATAI